MKVTEKVPDKSNRIAVINTIPITTHIIFPVNCIIIICYTVKRTRDTDTPMGVHSTKASKMDYSNVVQRMMVRYLFDLRIGPINYASRRSRARDTVKLTVCACVCLSVCSSNCSTVAMRRKLTGSIGF